MTVTDNATAHETIAAALLAFARAVDRSLRETGEEHDGHPPLTTTVRSTEDGWVVEARWGASECYESGGNLWWL